MTALTTCNHNFIVNQQGLKVCKECYFVEDCISITEIEQIIARNTDDTFKTYDADGIASNIIKLVDKEGA